MSIIRTENGIALRVIVTSKSGLSKTHLLELHGDQSVIDTWSTRRGVKTRVVTTNQRVPEDMLWDAAHQLDLYGE